MSGRAGRIAGTVVVAVLGVAAAVAVVMALPDGAAPTAATAAASSTAAQPTSTAASPAPTAASTAVRVPSAQDTATGDVSATEMTPPAAGTAGGPAAGTTVSPLVAAVTTSAASTMTLPMTAPAPPSPAAPAAPAGPLQPAAPPAAPTPAPVPRTTAPARTTAPKTTAPTTTAPPKTTTPKTTAPKTATAPDFTIPVALGNASQLITVTASSPSATRATLRAWQKSTNGSWRVVYGPVTAWVGSAGIGTASESTSRTPLGTFTLTEAFGAKADPGTALPYHRTGPNDWWVSDTRAASYNTMQTCAAASCPFRTSVSEHLQYIQPEYNYAVVMDVNRSPVVPGAGSAFFLHVTNGKPTAGCVAIDSSTLVSIMRWLDPAQHPRIATGIG